MLKSEARCSYKGFSYKKSVSQDLLEAKNLPLEKMKTSPKIPPEKYNFIILKNKIKTFLPFCNEVLTLNNCSSANSH